MQIFIFTPKSRYRYALFGITKSCLDDTNYTLDSDACLWRTPVNKSLQLQRKITYLDYTLYVLKLLVR